MLESLGRALQLGVEPFALQRLGEIVQDGHDADQLGLLGEDLAGDRLDGKRFARLRIHQADLAGVPRRLAGEQDVGVERGKVGVVRVHAGQHFAGGAGGRGEELLGRRVHQERHAARVGDQNGIGDRIDDEVEAVALGPDFFLDEVELAVIFLHLLGGSTQVHDVAEHRHHHDAARRILGDRADQLEEEIGPVDRIDQEQLTALRFRALDDPAGQRGREQHVVQRDGATPSLAFTLGRHQQRLGPDVREDDAAFHVGEEDRVGDGVDHALDQRQLALEPALEGGLLLPGAQAGQSQPEHLDQPRRLAHGLGRGHAQQNESGCLLGAFRTTERQDQEGRRSGQGRTAQTRPEGCRRELERRARPQRGDQRMIPLLERNRHARDRRRAGAVHGHGSELAGGLVHEKTDGPPHAGVIAQPVERPLGALGDDLAPEQELDEGQPRVAPADRRRRRPSDGGSIHVLDSRRTPPSSVASSGNLSAERGVLLEERFLTAALDGRSRRRDDLTDRLRVLQVGVDGRHHDARFDGDQIDADERDTDPGVDDDTLVQHSIEHVDEACAAGGPFNGHRSSSCCWLAGSSATPPPGRRKRGP